MCGTGFEQRRDGPGRSHPFASRACVSSNSNPLFAIFITWTEASLRKAKARRVIVMKMCGTGFEPADPYGTAS